MLKKHKETFITLSEMEVLPFLNMTILKRFFPNIKKFSLYQKIKRWIDIGKILQLRKGLYMSRVYFEKNQFDENFRVFIANNLLFPSYVSGAYVLQRYEILTDITHPIKGRDFYDLLWYMQKGILPNENALKADGIDGSIEEVFKQIAIIVAKMNLEGIKADLFNLFENVNYVDNWIASFRDTFERLRNTFYVFKVIVAINPLKN